MPTVLKLSVAALRAYEHHHAKSWRKRALDECFERIVFEVRSTNYASISPVNGLLNVLALFDRNHPDCSAAYQGVDYWGWEDNAEGIRYVGAHSHTWDTSFTVQAVLSGPGEISERTAASLRRAYCFLRDTQIRKEIPERERWFRDRLLGGWCFSDDHHQWPVSDCTAEALSAVLLWENMIPAGECIPNAQLIEAVEFILSWQNNDGGFGSFERRRGSLWLDRLNPSEMFGDCMVEGSYVECTASCIAGLARFYMA